MSPFLFSLFVNDFENAFINTLCDEIVFKRFSIVFVNVQFIILSYFLNQLQVTKHVKYFISVFGNVKKVLVFHNGGKIKTTSKWFYNGYELEVIDSFNHLGFTLNL